MKKLTREEGKAKGKPRLKRELWEVGGGGVLLIRGLFPVALQTGPSFQSFFTASFPHRLFFLARHPVHLSLRAEPRSRA